MKQSTRIQLWIVRQLLIAFLGAATFFSGPTSAQATTLTAPGIHAPPEPAPVVHPPAPDFSDTEFAAADQPSLGEVAGGVVVVFVGGLVVLLVLVLLVILIIDAIL